MICSSSITLRAVVLSLAVYYLLGASAALAQNSLSSFTDGSTGRIIFLKRVDTPQVKALTSLPIAASGETTSGGVAPSPVSSTYARSKANTFTSEQGSLFGLKSPRKELALINLKSDNLGMTHVRYEQRVKNLPVFSSSVAVHLDASGEVNSASAEIVPNMIIKNRQGVTSEVAVSKASAAFRKDLPGVAPVLKSTTEVIYSPGLIHHTASTDGYYAWKVDLTNPKNGADETYFIDERTGAVLFHLSGERYASVRKIYDCSTGTCLLDSYNSTYNYTFGRSEGQPARGPNPLSLPAIPTPVMTDTDDAYNIFGNINTFTTNIVGINGANRHGGLSVDLSNAVVATTFDTDSHCSNYNFGQYAGGEVRMCINSAYSDMGAHEYGHGVSSYAVSPLTYYGESGAHAEAFSDIYSESVQSWVYATNPPPLSQQPWVHLGDDADWAMGRWEDIVTWNRMLAYPDGMQENYVTGCSTSNYKPYPDRGRSPGWYCGSSDLGGLHHNATAIGKAASMLAMNQYPYGYTVFNDCRVFPIGYEKVVKIWFRATDIYYSASETFLSAYNKLIQACGDLYGGTSETCRQVTRALQAVEMDQGSTCGTPPAWHAPYCRDSHPLCLDSDNGLMPYKALGTTASDTDTVTVTGDPVPVRKDYTFTRKSLVEYNCNLNTRDKRMISCSWGGQDGRCLARSQNLC